MAVELLSSDAEYRDLSVFLGDQRANYDDLRNACRAREKEIKRLSVECDEMERQWAAREMGNVDSAVRARKLSSRIARLDAEKDRVLHRLAMYEHLLDRLRRQELLLGKQVEMERAEIEDARRRRRVAEKEHQAVKQSLDQALVERATAEQRAADRRITLERRLEGARRLLAEQEQIQARREERDKRKQEIALEVAGDLGAEDERRLRQMYTAKQLYSTMLSAKIAKHDSASAALQQGFQRIRAVTGLTDVPAIIEKYLSRDITFEQLRRQVARAQRAIDKQRDAVDQLTRQLDTLQSSSSAMATRELYREVDAYDQRLAETGRQRDELRARVRRAAAVTEDVRQCVGKLLLTLDPNGKGVEAAMAKARVADKAAAALAGGRAAAEADAEADADAEDGAAAGPEESAGPTGAEAGAQPEPPAEPKAGPERAQEDTRPHASPPRGRARSGSAATQRTSRVASAGPRRGAPRKPTAPGAATSVPSTRTDRARQGGAHSELAATAEATFVSLDGRKAALPPTNALPTFLEEVRRRVTRVADLAQRAVEARGLVRAGGTPSGRRGRGGGSTRPSPTASPRSVAPQVVGAGRLTIEGADAISRSLLAVPGASPPPDNVRVRARPPPGETPLPPVPAEKDAARRGGVTKKGSTRSVTSTGPDGGAAPVPVASRNTVGGMPLDAGGRPAVPSMHPDSPSAGPVGSGPVRPRPPEEAPDRAAIKRQARQAARRVVSREPGAGRGRARGRGRGRGARTKGGQRAKR